MTKGNAIRYYRKYSGAHGYIIGFSYKKKNYMIRIEGDIMPRFLKMGKQSSKKGGNEKLDLYLNNELKEELIRKGAIEIDYEIHKGNNGGEFEKWVQNYYGVPARDWDDTGFWQCGDLTIDGKEYQVKFEGAQFVTVVTLHGLQKMGKNWKNYVPQRGRKKKAN
jgi:hypothetical protein